MSRKNKRKKLKRMSIYGVSAASVFITTLWLKIPFCMKIRQNDSIIPFREEMQMLN